MSASDWPMTVEEFSEALDAMGADLMSWPDHQRERAEALLRSSDEARFLYSEAERLHMILMLAPRPKAPAGLADRIFKAAQLRGT